MPHPIFEVNPERRKPVLGAFVTFDAMHLVELLGGVGFDYLAIDTQHAMVDVVAAAKLIYAVPTGLPVLVRTVSNDAPTIGKLLDCGADGVIVPMVNTAAEAAAAVAACRYNPSGNRSFGPVRRHLGFDPVALQARAACFVMIETIEAVENIAEIAATPGLTGVYLGSGDLAVNMGLTPAGRPTPPAIREAAKKIAAASRRAGIIPAVHGQTIEHFAEMYSDGFSMITLSGDRTYVLHGANALLRAGREIGS